MNLSFNENISGFPDYQSRIYVYNSIDTAVYSNVYLCGYI